MTVNVDIASLAQVVSHVETPRALKACLQFAKIVKQGAAVTVVMTHQSWDAVTHNMGLDRTTEMLERVLDQQKNAESHLTAITSLLGVCNSTVQSLSEAAMEI